MVMSVPTRKEASGHRPVIREKPKKVKSKIKKRIGVACGLIVIEVSDSITSPYESRPSR
jgi:hypothetical protein